jgi:hypothetical protein
MKTFRFIPAHLWAKWNIKYITFFGSSGHYTTYQDDIYFFWDGEHVATKTPNGDIYYNKTVKLPRGFKTAAKNILTTQP